MFTGHVLCGVTPESATYNDSTNTVTIAFSENISSTDVLLGRISISDPSNSYTLTGGTLPDSNYYTDTLEINLVYGTVIDQLVQTLFGASQTVELWGNTTVQVDEIESFGMDNLLIHFEAGAFLDTAFSQSDSVTLPLSTSHFDNPAILSCSYSATHNTLQFVFDRPVQFDQIAEDRSVDGGPGDGSLDPQVGNNDPGEDRNDNDALDTEPNVSPFKIGIGDVAGNAVSLEGAKYIAQVADNDTIDLRLTINDAKRLETTLILDSMNLNLSEGAFRDTLYNMVATSSIAVSTTPDSLPLVADSAKYDYAKN
ncbi:uncharacterized protein METZ01_LOCUS226866, partial [marine metagenome]